MMNFFSKTALPIKDLKLGSGQYGSDPGELSYHFFLKCLFFICLVNSTLADTNTIEGTPSQPNQELPAFGLIDLGAAFITGVAIATILVNQYYKEEQKKQGQIPSKDSSVLLSSSSVTFDQVVGYEGIKKQLRQIIKSHGNRSDSEETKQLTRAILFSGPPGNGKTLLAKAFAGQTKRKLVLLNGSTSVDKWTGTGPANIVNAFRTARQNSPSVLFIDEVEALIFDRGQNDNSGGGGMENLRCVTTLIQELDRIKEEEVDVIVIAATNFKDKLDAAFLSRCPVQIVINNPSKNEREKIITACKEKYLCHEDVNVDKLVRQTSGFSIRDLESIFTTSKMIALDEAGEQQPVIKMIHIEEAIQRQTLGEVREDFEQTEKTMRRTAVHEAGHALVHFYTKDNTQIDRISILPRSKSLGHNSFIPDDENSNLSKLEALNRIAIALGGMVAENLVYPDDNDLGIADDLQRARKYAELLVSYGMYQSGSSPFFYPTENTSSLSEKKKEEQENRVEEVIKAAHDRVIAILSDHKDELDRLAQALLDNKTLTSEKITDIIKSDNSSNTVQLKA